MAKAIKTTDDRLAELGSRLAALYPDLTVTLDHSSALELLVATILSAQCTDARVNEVTPALFQRFPTAEDYAAADREELEEYVRSTGFYRNKAKHIQQMAARLVTDHGGEVPGTMEELVELPGVARKTANVILSNWFGVHEGVVVDTHVKRVAGRLGLTTETDPAKVERDLMELLDRDQWRPFAWRLILHGRSTCTARRPNCPGCELAELCPSAQAFDG
ncbi:MAG: endonuclease III [Gemmatimonadales bacterium]|jgi:endonuclease-3